MRIPSQRVSSVLCDLFHNLAWLSWWTRCGGQVAVQIFRWSRGKFSGSHTVTVENLRSQYSDSSRRWLCGGDYPLSHEFKKTSGSQDHHF